MQLNKIYNADCIEGMRNMPANSVDVCVTSPPYFALRDYGTAVWLGGNPNCDHKGPPMRTKENINKNCGTGADIKNKEAHEFYKVNCLKCGATRVDMQIGLENSPDAFVAKLGDVGDEIFRVLKPHGTLWLNLGDSYAGSGMGAANYPHLASDKQLSNQGSTGVKGRGGNTYGLKPKDLIGIPWMVAFEFRRRGWYLRQDDIWYKPNPMPESVTDRCTKAHEYIFLLSKSQKYFFDAEAIKTDAVTAPENHGPKNKLSTHKNLQPKGQRNHTMHEKRLGLNGSGFKGHSGNYSPTGELIGNGKANKRSVWICPTQPYSEAHFATFPEALIVDCIKAGSSEHGNCSQCGKPYIRITEKKYRKHEKYYGERQNIRHTRDKAGSAYNEVIDTQTIGWNPTCKCNAPIAPAIVFDPFMGAGTTAVVARKLNRNFVGIELNPKYITIAEKRLRKEIGLFL